MFGYKVKITKDRYFYESAKEQYGEWSASSGHSIDNYITREEEHPDVTAPFELLPGDKAYVVWVQWSSGDSFGYESGADAEAVAIFKDLQVAVKLITKIQNDAKSNTLKFIGENQTIDIKWCPWSGYFEHVDFVQYKEVEMK